MAIFNSYVKLPEGDGEFHRTLMGNFVGLNRKLKFQSRITEDWDCTPATDMLKLTHEFEV